MAESAAPGRAVVEDYLVRAASLDPDLYAAIWADNGRLEMPFHPEPDARTLVGRVAIRARMALAAEVLKELRWIDPVIRATDELGTFVVEMESRATRHDGGVYQNRYVIVASVREGSIALWREYFNPTAL